MDRMSLSWFSFAWLASTFLRPHSASFESICLSWLGLSSFLGPVSFDSARLGSARLGLSISRLSLLGLAWYRFGSNWLDFLWLGLVWSFYAWSLLASPGLV